MNVRIPITSRNEVGSGWDRTGSLGAGRVLFLTEVWVIQCDLKSVWQ